MGCVLVDERWIHSGQQAEALAEVLKIWWRRPENFDYPAAATLFNTATDAL